MLCVPAQTTASDAGCEGIYPYLLLRLGEPYSKGQQQAWCWELPAESLSIAALWGSLGSGRVTKPSFWHLLTRERLAAGSELCRSHT